MQICLKLEPPHVGSSMGATAQRTVQKCSVWPASLVFGKDCTTFRDRTVEPVDYIQQETSTYWVWLRWRSGGLSTELTARSSVPTVY